VRFVPKYMPWLAGTPLLADTPVERPASHPTDKAYANILVMFFNNEIALGQRISITELAARFAMSPTPIVQALKWLEVQGLVRHEHNKGYYTQQCTPKEILEIYELRELLESSLVPAIVANLDRDNLAYLEQALGAHLESLNQNVLSIRSVTDMEFHLAIASISGKETHMAILSNMFQVLYIKYRNRHLFYEPLVSSKDDHLKIFDAIAQRDVELASSVLREHIRNIKDHAAKCLVAYPGAHGEAIVPR